MPRIFISHSSRDNAAATELITWLKTAGFEEVFLDFDRYHGIPPGDDWERRLYGEIQRATAVVLLLTRNWFDSKWCFVEFTQARALGKSVLPIIVTSDGNQFIGDNLQKIDLVANRHEGLDRLLHRLHDIALDGPSGFSLPRGRPPYPGMLSFDRDDAAVYFGREREVRQTLESLERLRRRGGAKVLHIHGESGSGKSSLLKAGVLPQLDRRVSDWIVPPIFRPGMNPLGELRASLRMALSGEASATLDELIANPTAAAAACVVDALHKSTGNFQATVLISIDQFEEAFTLPTPDEQNRFVRVLSALLDPTLKSLGVTTLRTGDLPRVVDGLGMQSEESLISPFPLDHLPEIVRKPALVVGMQVEDALVGALVRDALTADTLPLVAFLLRRLHDRRASDYRLTVAEYNALGDANAGLMPFETCVRDAADTALKRVNPTKDEEAALREAFVPGLVRLNDAGQFVRRVLPASKVLPHAKRLIDALVDERLLIRREDGAIEVSHEALFRVWPPLKTWIEEEREFLVGKSRLEAAHADWQKTDALRRSEALLSGLLLGRAEAWLMEHPGRFAAGERQFIELSIHARENAAQKVRRAQQRQIGAALVSAVVFAVLGSVAWIQLNEATRQARIAKEQSDRAREQEHIASERARDAERERTIARRQTYIASISAARVHLEQGQVNEVCRVLDAAPSEERNWEWGFYRAQANTSLACLSGHESLVLTASFSADGTRVVTASFDKTARVWDAASGKVLSVLRGHDFPVGTAVISGDGARVVTVSFPPCVRVWDAASGKEVAELRGHDGEVKAAAFSTDGTRVVTASSDKTARVWDAASGREVAGLRGHEKSVLSAAFSSDGTRVVTASDDKTARVWDAASGKEVFVLRGHVGEVRAAAFSADGSRVVTASSDKTARVWDAASGREVAALRGHEGELISAKFSPDGTRVVTTSHDKTARVWDATSEKEITLLRVDVKDPSSAVFSPDGARVAIVVDDKTVRVCGVSRGHEDAVMRGHEHGITSVAFSPDGTRVVTASADRTARIWDTTRSPEVTVLRGHDRESAVYSASFSPNGMRVATASGDKTARVWDVASGREVSVLRGHERWVMSATFSPDSTRVVTASDDKTARVWDAASGREVLMLRGHDGEVRAAAFSADGTRVVTASDDKTARVWDAASGREVLVLRGHEEAVEYAVFSPDGTQIVTAARDGTARVWDAASGREVSVLRGHQFDFDDTLRRGFNELFERGVVVQSAAFNSDGTRVATASNDNTARVWDTASGRQVAVLRGHVVPDLFTEEASVYSVAFSPDGTRVVTAADDKTARIWDSASGREVAVLVGHEGRVNSAAFSPDGKRVVTASLDKTVRVWDALSGREFAVLHGHDDEVRSAVFSPDGTRIVAASSDGTARIWDSIPAAERYKAMGQPLVPRFSLTTTPTTNPAPKP